MFFSTLSAAMSCWFTHTGRKAWRPRETVPSTPPFFTFFLLCPLSSSPLPLRLSHSGDLELPLLTSNKTLLTCETVALCQDTHSHGCLKCTSNTRGVSRSLAPGLLILAHLCCILLHVVQEYLLSVTNVCMWHAYFYSTLWIFYFRKLQSCTSPFWHWAEAKNNNTKKSCNNIQTFRILLRSNEWWISRNSGNFVLNIREKNNPAWRKLHIWQTPAGMFCWR